MLYKVLDELWKDVSCQIKFRILQSACCVQGVHANLTQKKKSFTYSKGCNIESKLYKLKKELNQPLKTPEDTEKA